MITLIGTEGTAEYEAAQSVVNALLRYWPNIAATPAEEESIIVSAGAKISGYKIQDIDVLLCAKFRAGRQFIPGRPVRDRGEVEHTGQPIGVSNLVVVIEVKDQDASRVRFTGESVSVEYTRSGRVQWHNATQQNIDQAHVLKDYFSDQHADFYVHRLLILRGLNAVKVPGVLPREFTGKELLTEIAALSGVISSGSSLFLRSGSAAHIARAVAAPIFRELRPTTLDRRRMDRIAGRKEQSGGWSNYFGRQMLILRGRGGSGKTIMLLQAAWRAYDERGARTLFLTYNLALVADVRRMMALLNIPSTPQEGGIAVDSVMSLVMSWLAHLGLADGAAEDALENYDENCTAAAALVREGALSREEVDSLKSKYPDKLDFDFVVVDEGQDWPQAEAELIKYIYGATDIAAADGIDQLVRGPRCDWFFEVPEELRASVRLRECLRMKANLTSFARQLSSRVDLSWDADPSSEAVGGRIILVRGEYAGHSGLHLELLSDAKKAGNEPIDLLFCVPPSDVAVHGGNRESALARALSMRGFSVWDGTRMDVRRDFARSPDMLRIVQYASCRGLEGWTVVCDCLDDFWQSRFDSFTAAAASVASTDNQRAAAREAWRWCMMPLTRGIDTLVISLRDPESTCGRSVVETAKQLRDCVEIRF